jgi:hypothetical protein
MGTFRFNERGFAPLGLRHLARLRRTVGLWFVVFSLACVSREGAPEASSAGTEVAAIQRIQIEHLVPRPNFVGPLPVRLEWTAAAGVDTYEVGVENEIEIPVFDQGGIKTTSVPWPKEARVEPGTYYWRITGYQDGRLVADSGRAAFVVHEP